jgi:hypothetical protein
LIERKVKEMPIYLTVQGRVYNVKTSQAQNGTEYVNVGISDSVRNPQGEYQTRWLNVTAWGRDAENLKTMEPGTAVIAICRVDSPDPKSGLGNLRLVGLSRTQDTRVKSGSNSASDAAEVIDATPESEPDVFTGLV